MEKLQEPRSLPVAVPSPRGIRQPIPGRGNGGPGQRDVHAGLAPDGRRVLRKENRRLFRSTNFRAPSEPPGIRPSIKAAEQGRRSFQ
ncbi:MAG: hypothetical protein CW346_01210 [Bacillaceae bacterium]|nr:hypothetical protein [Bacillaceae bacterium]MBY6270807.1 hypothetical protein [Bacillaceae bacterium]